MTRRLETNFLLSSSKMVFWCIIVPDLRCLYVRGQFRIYFECFSTFSIQKPFHSSVSLCFQRENWILRPNMAQIDHREQFVDWDCSLGSYSTTSTYLALLKRPSFVKTRRNSKQRSQNCQESALRDKMPELVDNLSRKADSWQFWLLCFEIRAGFGKAGSFQKC